ncbi:CinA family protein [Roseibium polysiphoniae]|uniref:CinA family protein n=1 Tax=Roseibium polysiphoniae TaxID=2571221 RepID=A0A944CC40_9HYPH|nr:CinA family protein [Roseibium polysiphoniae]MBS8259443.1 CinA family protein [Roseibium polysiphoniae]
MTQWIDQLPKAESIVADARRKGLIIATAESCTGGLIAGLLTEVPGSSAVIDRGFVTYSNEAKQEMLGVPFETLEAVGAVSRETAIAMAEGALKNSHADMAVSVTGIAGPGGGSSQKPVGTVHLALAAKNQKTEHLAAQFGDLGRDEVRLQAVVKALELISNSINSPSEI